MDGASVPIVSAIHRRQRTILLVGIISYWTVPLLYPIIFFLHAPYIAFTFYRTYYRVRRSLSSRIVDGNAPRWWTEETKREVLSLHHSFVLCCHLIILFGLLCLGIAVFCYIFYALEEYGSVIESATNATEELSE